MVQEIVLVLSASFVIALYGLRQIIFISHKTHLFDEPSEDRKIHGTRTPKLGGVAIFASVLAASFFFLSYTSIPHVNYLLFSCSILFILGVTDDLVDVNPSRKIIAQAVAALAVTVFGEYRFTGFNGLFGLAQMPYPLSIAVSFLFVLFLTNAFNLIDGINCLAGGIGLLACLTFSFYFSSMHQEGFMLTSLALCGALACFLLFNRTPARIFMGDTGSTLLGFIIAIFAIHFIEGNPEPASKVNSPVGLTLALLIVPTFDTLRIFTIRLSRRKSPFLADRNHIHHRLIDMGLTHLQATGILVIATIAALMLTLLPLGTELLLVLLALYAIGLNALLSILLARRRSRQAAKATISVTYKQSQPRMVIHEIKSTVGQ